MTHPSPTRRPAELRRAAPVRLALPAQARVSLGLPLVGEAPGAAVRPAGPRKRIGLGKASRTSLCEVDAPRRGADHPANAACNGRGTVTMSRNIDLNAVLSELGPRFAAGAAAHAADDSFVTENYRALRTAKVFSAQVPTDLGGKIGRAHV